MNMNKLTIIHIKDIIIFIKSYIVFIYFSFYHIKWIMAITNLTEIACTNSVSRNNDTQVNILYLFFNSLCLFVALENNVYNTRYTNPIHIMNANITIELNIIKNGNAIKPFKRKLIIYYPPFKLINIISIFIIHN